MKKCIPVFLGLLALSAGCKSKNSTPAELLTGRWKLTAKTATYSVQGFPLQQNAYSALGACTQDNLFVYSSDGTYSLDEGATTCTYGDPQTKPLGNWVLDEAGTTLTYYNTSGTSNSVTITELGATTLRTTAAESLAVGPLSYASQTIATYTRQ